MPYAGKVIKKLKGKPLFYITIYIYRDDWDILWVDREVIYDVLNHTHL